MQPGIDIGPAVDEAQLHTVLEYIEIGKKEAGAPKIGGNPLSADGLSKGYFVDPAIFADVTAKMCIAQEEIFSTVLAGMRANDLRHGNRIAHSTPFYTS